MMTREQKLVRTQHACHCVVVTLLLFAAILSAAIVLFVTYNCIFCFK
jgi:hypothetical protein